MMKLTFIILYLFFKTKQQSLSFLQTKVKAELSSEIKLASELKKEFDQYNEKNAGKMDDVINSLIADNDQDKLVYKNKNKNFESLDAQTHGFTQNESTSKHKELTEDIMDLDQDDDIDLSKIQNLNDIFKKDNQKQKTQNDDERLKNQQNQEIKIQQSNSNQTQVNEKLNIDTKQSEQPFNDKESLNINDSQNKNVYLIENNQEKINSEIQKINQKNTDQNIERKNVKSDHQIKSINQQTNFDLENQLNSLDSQFQKTQDPIDMLFHEPNQKKEPISIQIVESKNSDLELLKKETEQIKKVELKNSDLDFLEKQSQKDNKVESNNSDLDLLKNKLQKFIPEQSKTINKSPTSQKDEANFTQKSGYIFMQTQENAQLSSQLKEKEQTDKFKSITHQDSNKKSTFDFSIPKQDKKPENILNTDQKSQVNDQQDDYISDQIDNPQNDQELSKKNSNNLKISQNLSNEKKQNFQQEDKQNIAADQLLPNIKNLVSSQSTIIQQNFQLETSHIQDLNQRISYQQSQNKQKNSERNSLKQKQNQLRTELERVQQDFMDLLIQNEKKVAEVQQQNEMIDQMNQFINSIEQNSQVSQNTFKKMEYSIQSNTKISNNSLNEIDEIKKDVEKLQNEKLKIINLFKDEQGKFDQESKELSTNQEKLSSLQDKVMKSHQNFDFSQKEIESLSTQEKIMFKSIMKLNDEINKESSKNKYSQLEQKRTDETIKQLQQDLIKAQQENSNIERDISELNNRLVNKGFEIKKLVVDWEIIRQKQLNKIQEIKLDFDKQKRKLQSEIDEEVEFEMKQKQRILRLKQIEDKLYNQQD